MRVDRASPQYRKAFEAYLRYGTPINLAGGVGLEAKAEEVTEERPTTHYIWRTRLGYRSAALDRYIHRRAKQLLDPAPKLPTEFPGSTPYPIFDHWRGTFSSKVLVDGS